VAAPDVRRVQRRDLPVLAAIEDEADGLYRDLFGATDWDPPTPGEERARHPGFLLVAGDPPEGFVHVLELGGIAHLEQLAVRRSAMRQGLGSALVLAAMGEARARGHAELSLCTYAEVPWNGPFYARLGFVESDDPGPVLRDLRAREQDLGLDRHGRRTVMCVAL
jgi:GNAT superfamily N-acetyltransferase